MRKSNKIIEKIILWLTIINLWIYTIYHKQKNKG